MLRSSKTSSGDRASAHFTAPGDLGRRVLPSFDEGPEQYDVWKFLFRFVGPALPPDGMNQVHNI